VVTLKRKRKLDLNPIWFSAPALILYASMVVYPLIFTIFISFFDWRGVGYERKYVGISNYIEVFKDPVTWIALKNNVIWMVVLLVIPTILGFFIAILLEKSVRGEWFFKGAFYIPGVISLATTGVIFSLIFRFRHGFISEFLDFLKLDFLKVDFLGSTTLAVFATIAGAVWQQTGFNMVLFIAGIRGINVEVLEASYIDGANSTGTVRYIVLPLLTPVISIVVIFNLLVALKSFDLVILMTRGGPFSSTQVLALLMYQTAFGKQLFGPSAVLGILIFILCACFGIFYVRQLQKLERG